MAKAKLRLKKKTPIKRSEEKAQEVAEKIEIIFQQIGFLSEDDVEYLKDTARLIREEQSKRQAVAGILVPLEKAEMANALGEQASDRITGLVLIWSAMKQQPKILAEYREKASQSAEIEKMFGL